MVYPANCTCIPEDEMVYVEGGALSDWFDKNGVLGVVDVVATAYGALVAAFNLPALVGALADGYTLGEIANATFGPDQNGNSQLLVNGVSCAAGLWALYKGASALCNVFTK